MSVEPGTEIVFENRPNILVHLQGAHGLEPGTLCGCLSKPGVTLRREEVSPKAVLCPLCEQLDEADDAGPAESCPFCSVEMGAGSQYMGEGARRRFGDHVLRDHLEEYL